MDIERKRSKLEMLDDRTTPWVSIWSTAFMLALVGVQMSIYFMSSYQYLNETDPTATVEFYGWVIAACSLGCALSNPIYGYWNQKTMSTRNPVTFGFTVSTIGNLLYALLPLQQENIKYTMLLARFLTGFGAGTLGVLRGYIGTASTRVDRVKAVALGTAFFCGGLSLGPALQIVFIPLGHEGFYIGRIVVNMYTGAAFFMAIISFISIIIANTVFVEDYVGIISDEDKKSDPFLVIPKYDKMPVAVLFMAWWMLCGVAATEGLAAPITIAMYNWSSEEAILYNGLVQVVACLVSSFTYTIIGVTRIGRIDRRFLLSIGLTGFFIFHIVHIPWPFYEGPLDRPKFDENGTIPIGAGGCSYEFSWCESTTRVPLYLYLFCFAIIQGLAFPLISTPCNTLLSEIIGPRKQGLMTGLFAFTGSISQFFVPIMATTLFEVSGFLWIMIYHLIVVFMVMLFAFIYRKRLIPLQLIPNLEIATKYKRGTFYRF